MKIHRTITLLGIILGLVAHLISWTTPDIIDFAIIGVPLHIVATIILWRLYNKRVLPLQEQTDLRWFHHASSGVHALLFLAVLSFMFHVVVVILGISAWEQFVMRALSSIWLYVFTLGYGYTSWAGRHQVRVNQIRRQGSHRARIRQKANLSKAGIPHRQTQSWRYRS